MPKCVLLSCEDLTDYTVDDDLLIAPFAAQGWDAVFVPWSLPDIDWSQYDAAIIRATWDYHLRLPEFLPVLRRIEDAGVPLYNPFGIVDWNAHKGYMMELADKGVPIVPTRVYTEVRDAPLAELFDTFATNELIVKPMVSAGAFKTHWFKRDDLATLEAQFHEDLTGHDVMVQPFVRSLLGAGEYSLFYFNNVLSHTVVKQPVPGDFRVQEEHGGIITPAQANAEQLAVGEAVLAALPQECLYARVDIVQADSGEWQLMEVELIEPSLYFRMDEGSPERFVRAFLDRQG